MYTPETLAELARLRAKALTPGYSLEDMKRYVEIARQGRLAAAAASASSGKRKSKTPIDVDKLFDDLEK